MGMATLLVGAIPTAPLSLNLPSQSHALSSSHSQTHGLSFSLSSSSATAPSATSLPLIYCGRGDRKTAKGKRFAHSFGNARPRDKKKGRGPPRIPVPAVPLQTDKDEEEEVVKIEIDESLLSG